MDASDLQLLDEFRARRDEAAFTEIVRRHGPMVHRVCLRATKDAGAAEDATQAVFLVLLRRVDGLNRSVRLAAWLHGVARRIAMDAGRARARNFAREHADMERIEGTPAKDRAVERSELLNLLDGALVQLPVALREAVVLRHLEGLSQEEAADRAGCPRGTMAWRTSEGLERLRRRLAKFEQRITVPDIERVLCRHRDLDVPEGLLERLARLATDAPELDSVRRLAASWLRTQRIAVALVVGAALLAVALLAFAVDRIGRSSTEVMSAPWTSYIERLVRPPDRLPDTESAAAVVRGLSGRAECALLPSGAFVVAPASGSIVYADHLDSGVSSLVVIEHRRADDSRFCSVLLFPGRLAEDIASEKSIGRDERLGIVVADRRMPFAWFGLHEGPYDQMMPGQRELWEREVRGLAREMGMKVADDTIVDFEMLDGLAAAALIDGRPIVNIALERSLCANEPRPMPLADWCLLRSDDEAWLSPRSLIGRPLGER